MNNYPFMGTTVPNYMTGTIPNYASGTPFLPKQEAAKVNGREGALAYPLGSDSSVLALDLNDPILWIIVSDSAGYKTATPWDISKHAEDPIVKTSDLNSQLEKLTSRMDDLEERMNTYGQSSTRLSDISNGKPSSNVTQSSGRND